MRPSGLVVLVALSFALFAATAAAKEIERDFHESFDVEEGFELDLRHGDGDVTITPWDKDLIDVTVRYRADVTRIGFGGDPGFDVEFTKGDDFVRVVGRAMPAGPAVLLSVRRHEYTYAISAPPYVKLELHGDDGDVGVSGWLADIDCELDDGDVVLRDVENAKTLIRFKDGDVSISGLSGNLILFGDDGDVSLADCVTPSARIAIADGDVTASRCQGEFSVETDDGSVVLDSVQATAIEVETEDGDIDIGLGDPEVGEIVVETDDGDVAIVVEPQSSFAFMITVDDGSVRVSIPGSERLEKSKHSVSGVVRGGRGNIVVRTEDGDVLLREAD